MENGERKVRHADVGMADIAGVARAVQDMYDDRLDVLIVRGALDATRLAALGEQLDRDDRDPGPQPERLSRRGPQRPQP